MYRRIPFAFLIAGFLLLMGLDGVPRQTLAAPLAQQTAITPTPQTAATGEIVQAVQAAIDAHQEVAAFAINQITVDHVDVASGGRQALVYLTALDPRTGQPIAREPGLAIATLAPSALSSSATWQVTFQSDSDWQTQFASLPPAIKPQEYQLHDAAAATQTQSTQGLTLGGYLLPWAGGQAKTLTWSVSHASCSGEDCRYAFDWWDGTHFPLLAAKGGAVFDAVWNWPNDDHASGHTNYLVLQDTSTSLVSYQIYYHMEQNSIPEELRVKGAPVTQGEFVGRADNTGASTGSHLHFMVHTNSYGLWGQSVDITFRDVKINWDAATQGGRPRMCRETTSLPQYGAQCQTDDKFISGNYGSNPPDGGLSLPADGTVIKTASAHVEGWGKDDLGITRMQVIAKWGGAWTEIGASQTANPFAVDINLCAANIPDGPVNLALNLWDTEGNQVTGSQGSRTILKQASCLAAPPPPPCTPGAEQVALYSEPNFAGACQLFTAGAYPDALSLGSLGDNQAASIQVGSNASATLYRDASYQGRAETIIASDRNLADNAIGSGTTSSLTVQKLGANTLAPALIVSTGLTSDDSVILAWRDVGGAYQFMPDLYKDGVAYKTRIFDHVYSWSLDSLPAGSYSLTVCAVGTAIANPNSYYHCPVGWTASTATFSVTQAAVTPARAAMPYTATFDSGAENWTTSGTDWALGPGFNSTQGFGFNLGGACGDGARCSGALTSPAIQVPASGDSYLRFKYKFTAAELGVFTDLRRVQISASSDGGSTFSGFTDLLALAKPIQDTPDSWLDSPDGIRLACSSYCGKLVRIRFFFDSLDGVLNTGLSWSVDQVSLTQVAPPTVTETAEPVLLTANGAAISGALNPIGDVDLFKFSATLNSVYQADLTPQKFTPSLELLDDDQSSVLGLGQAAGSAWRVSFRAPKTGTFYLRVKTYPYPQDAPGNSYTIALKTLTDTTWPVVSLVVPVTNGYLNGAAAALAVSASDNSGEISRVDYYVHLPDGAIWRWWKLGTSGNAANSWAIPFDPTFFNPSSGLSVWARATDWAGNSSDAILWNLGVDSVPPVSALNPLTGPIHNTAVQLNWNAADHFSGVDHVQIQYQVNGGDWQDGPTSSQSPYWFVGRFGNTYAFRIRAVDRAGNMEAYPAQAEASVQMVDPGDGGDPYEAQDAALASAPVLAVDGNALARTFYNQGGAADVDWVSFQAEAGTRYLIWVTPPNGSPAGAQVSLFTGVVAAQSGTAAVTQAAAGLGNPLLVIWTASQSGPVWVKLTSIDPNVQGSGVSYQVKIGTKYKTYLGLMK